MLCSSWSKAVHLSSQGTTQWLCKLNITHKIPPAGGVGVQLVPVDLKTQTKGISVVLTQPAYENNKHCWFTVHTATVTLWNVCTNKSRIFWWILIFLKLETLCCVALLIRGYAQSSGPSVQNGMDRYKFSFWLVLYFITYLRWPHRVANLFLSLLHLT